jgi:hypothetical protein
MNEAWRDHEHFVDALIQARRTVLVRYPTICSTLTQLIAHWKVASASCPWRKDFHDELVAFDECRDVRHTPTNVNDLLSFAVSLGRCDLVQTLAPHFQPDSRPSHITILWNAYEKSLLPVLRLLIDLQPLRPEDAEQNIYYLARKRFLSVSFFALKNVYSDYQLIRYAPLKALSTLEAYGVCVERERLLVEILATDYHNYSRVRYLVKDVKPSEQIIELFKCATTHFVVFDDEARARLRPELRELIDKATYESNWVVELQTEDLAVLPPAVVSMLTERWKLDWIVGRNDA